MISKQETFDTVVYHLRKQGCRATTFGIGCAYRAEVNGEVLKCAAGCLIPNALYTPDMESRGIVPHNPSANLPTAVIYALGHDLDLVAELQSVHDAGSTDRWESRFAEIAENHGLHYSPVVSL